ncbi:condensation domain-containing protein [Roseibium aggregatum]|uniref:condensation domain-containing protein n=1 Tax=Roseibium aggregatum TaxID=187304 RepID=UPI001E517441|nr:condensation domain-containing protein [Roseibium aggregatum]
MSVKAVSCELAPVQERFFSGPPEEWNEPAYNIHFALALASPLSRKEISDSVRELCVQNPVLMTRIDLDGKTVRQVQDARLSSLFEFCEYPIEIETTNQKVRYLSRIVANYRFDMCTSLFKCLIFSDVKNDIQHFVFLVHHSIFDGGSIGILKEEFERIFILKRENTYESSTFEYTTYVQAQSTDKAQSIQLRGLEFWKEVLQGIPAFYWKQKEELWNYSGKRINFFCDNAEIVRQKNRSSTTFVSSFVAFHEALATITGKTDIAIGVPVSLRPLGFERTIGMFANIIPIRASPSTGQHDFHSMKVAIWDALDHRETPLDKILKEFPSYCENNTQSIFGSMLTFMKISTAKTLHFKNLPLTPNTTSFDLTLYASECSERMHFQLDYAPNRISEKDAAMISELFLNRMSATSTY